MNPPGQIYNEADILNSLELLSRIRNDDVNLQIQQKRKAAAFLKDCIGNMQLNEVLYNIIKRCAQHNIPTIDPDICYQLSKHSKLYDYSKLDSISKKFELALEAFRNSTALDEKITPIEIRVLYHAAYVKSVLDHYRSILVDEVDLYLADIYKDFERYCFLYNRFGEKIYEELAINNNKILEAGVISITDPEKIKNAMSPFFKGFYETFGNIHVYGWFKNNNNEYSTIEIVLEQCGNFKKNTLTSILEDGRLHELLITDHYELDTSVLIPEEYRNQLNLHQLKGRYKQEFSEISKCVCLVEERLGRDRQTRASNLRGVTGTMRSYCGGRLGFISVGISCFLFPELSPGLVIEQAIIYSTKYNIFSKSDLYKRCERIMNNPLRIMDELYSLLESNKTMICSEFVSCIMLMSLASLYGKLISENHNLREFLKIEDNRLFPINSKIRTSALTPLELINQGSRCLKKKQLSEKILKIVDTQNLNIFDMKLESRLDWLKRYLDKHCREITKNLIETQVIQERSIEGINKEQIKEECRAKLYHKLHEYNHQNNITLDITDDELEEILNRHHTNIDRIALDVLNALPQENITNNRWCAIF